DDKADVRAFFAAMAALDLHRWKEAAALSPPPKGGRDTYWARAIGAARSVELQAASADIKHLEQLITQGKRRGRGRSDSAPNEKFTDLREANAWLAFAMGKTDEAVSELRGAVDQEDREGGEGVGLSAREMLADMLLEFKRPADA